MNDNREEENVIEQDELLLQARMHSEGGVVPETWGARLELEENGGTFRGRYRGSDKADGFKSGVYLFWDEDDQLVFLWGCYRLDQEFERESPRIGDDVGVFRGPNYKTRYDEDGDASGLGYGVKARRNDTPVPETPVLDEDDDIPW